VFVCVCVVCVCVCVCTHARFVRVCMCMCVFPALCLFLSHLCAPKAAWQHCAAIFPGQRKQAQSHRIGTSFCTECVLLCRMCSVCRLFCVSSSWLDRCTLHHPRKDVLCVVVVARPLHLPSFSRLFPSSLRFPFPSPSHFCSRSCLHAQHMDVRAHTPAHRQKHTAHTRKNKSTHKHLPGVKDTHTHIPGVMARSPRTSSTSFRSSPTN